MLPTAYTVCQGHEDEQKATLVNSSLILLALSRVYYRGGGPRQSVFFHVLFWLLDC
jgi:hypothetical protein